MSLLLGSTVCLSVVPESEYRPLLHRMSSSGLTSEAQLRYILQWFGEFSELQREDFLPILAAARSDRAEQLAATLAGLSCQDKPVSLFQCRLKLFNEWYPSWSEEEQERLAKGISESDPDFSAKLQSYITDGPKVNGDTFEVEERVVEPANNDDIEVIAENIEEPIIPQENIPVEITAAS